MRSRRLSGPIAAAVALTLAAAVTGIAAAAGSPSSAGPPAVVGALLAAASPGDPANSIDTALPAKLNDAHLDTMRARATKALRAADLATAREHNAHALLHQPLATADPSLVPTVHHAAASNLATARKAAVGAVRRARAALSALNSATARLATSLGGRGDPAWDIYGAQLWQNYLARVTAAGITWPTDDQLIDHHGVESTHDALGPLTVITRSAVVAVTYAFHQIGKPYKFGATGPAEFDCSGLTQAAFAQAGIDLPRTASDQWSVLQPVRRNQVAPGDLAFYENKREGIHHVAFYLGQGVILDAPFTGQPVRVEPDWGGFWGYGRATLPQRTPVAAPVPTHPQDDGSPQPTTSPAPQASASPSPAHRRHHRPSPPVGPLHVHTPHPASPTPSPSPSEVSLR